MNPTTGVAKVLATVFDPELAIDVVNLGLIYGIACDPEGITVQMSTTSESCPFGELLLEAAGAALREEFPAARIQIVLASSPPWDPGMLASSARARLGLPRA